MKTPKSMIVPNFDNFKTKIMKYQNKGMHVFWLPNNKENKKNVPCSTFLLKVKSQILKESPKLMCP